MARKDLKSRVEHYRIIFGHYVAMVLNKAITLQDTLGSASDKADHHATQASKQGQSYLDSAKDQANQLFGQGKVRHYLCLL